MNRNLKKWTILIALILLAVVLIPSATLVAGAEVTDACPVYVPVELAPVQPLDFSSGTPYAPHADGYLPENMGYRDDSINVQITTMRRYDTDIMVAFVQIADASQLRTELCKPYPAQATAPAANLARRVRAVFAINGDYFSYINTGCIVRNGDWLRKRFDPLYDLLIIDDQGDFHIISPMTEQALNAYQGTIAQTMCFGPALVIDGEVNYDYRVKTSVPTHQVQRMAIGQLDKLSYVIVAAEGPENKNAVGLTMKELADLMVELGAVNAYNLDGGSSSTMVLQGAKINALSSGKVRPIADILYFVTALPEGQ